MEVVQDQREKREKKTKKKDALMSPPVVSCGLGSRRGSYSCRVSLTSSSVRREGSIDDHQLETTLSHFFLLLPIDGRAEDRYAIRNVITSPAYDRPIIRGEDK